uniref:Endoplasmic reticulum lectin 1 n=1 Tax=Pipistrellus kuhlii TaxID=59472 RepID=A0A7J7VUP3_PIPKU|nr:endoplasmic reticulum lectin 1 [Pipistrellus kuhlii]
MEEGGGGGGARSLAPGGPVLLVLCGLLEASGGARALPQLSDDIPFRVNWPGTEFSLQVFLQHVGMWMCPPC